MTGEYMDRNSLESGLVFSALMAVAVIYFEAKAGFLVRKEYFALSAYLPAIFGAFLFGICFAKWYQPVEGEKLYMELILVPLSVIFFSVLVASLIFSLASISFGGMRPNIVMQYLSSAIFPAIVFVVGTWHILLFGGIASSLFLGWRNKCF